MEETVLVTGCSSDIGHATARRFLAADWTVYATAREGDDVTDPRERGCRTDALDVTDDEEAAAVVDRVLAERGSVDCLVNNAGYGQFGAIEEVPIAEVRRQFDVNTFGPLRLARAVVPRMRERGEGTIVNVTAGVGGLNVPGMGVYTASKYALESAIDALREEVSGAGVGVVAIRPGAVATDFYLLAYLFWYMPALLRLPGSVRDPPAGFPWHWPLDFVVTGLTGGVLVFLGFRRATNLSAE